ncbi:MAG: hypothetical protein LC105_02415 [Chitinophagales bacterium]|nr:hypothetical protein [Chitinophagales bacterium]MCZ2392697.1 hypothetical protein [Chitinophagales bacterium]
MMFRKNIQIILPCLFILLISCKKKDDFTPIKYAEETILYPENIEDIDALLMAIRDDIGIDLLNKEISVDFAFARFGQTNSVDVGDVKLNNILLSKTSANQYISPIDKNNFNLNSGIQNKWEIEGGSDYSAFNKSASIKMPAKITLDQVPDVIPLNQAITLKVNGLPSNAQAIIWQLKDINNQYIQKETTTSQLTITIDELKQLSLGENSLLKVAAYSLEKWEMDGKKFAFLNEFVETKNIQLK